MFLSLDLIHNKIARKTRKTETSPDLTRKGWKKVRSRENLEEKIKTSPLPQESPTRHIPDLYVHPKKPYYVIGLGGFPRIQRETRIRSKSNSGPASDNHETNAIPWSTGVLVGRPSKGPPGCVRWVHQFRGYGKFWILDEILEFKANINLSVNSIIFCTETKLKDFFGKLKILKIQLLWVCRKIGKNKS